MPCHSRGPPITLQCLFRTYSKVLGLPMYSIRYLGLLACVQYLRYLKPGFVLAFPARQVAPTGGTAISVVAALCVRGPTPDRQPPVPVAIANVSCFQLCLPSTVCSPCVFSSILRHLTIPSHASSNDLVVLRTNPPPRHPPTSLPLTFHLRIVPSSRRRRLLRASFRAGAPMSPPSQSSSTGGGIRRCDQATLRPNRHSTTHFASSS